MTPSFRSDPSHVPAILALRASLSAALGWLRPPSDCIVAAYRNLPASLSTLGVERGGSRGKCWRGELPPGLPSFEPPLPPCAAGDRLLRSDWLKNLWGPRKFVPKVPSETRSLQACRRSPTPGDRSLAFLEGAPRLPLPSEQAAVARSPWSNPRVCRAPFIRSGHCLSLLSIRFVFFPVENPLSGPVVLCPWRLRPAPLRSASPQTMILLSPRCEKLLKKLRLYMPDYSDEEHVKIALEQLLATARNSTPTGSGGGDPSSSSDDLLRSLWIFAVGIIFGSCLACFFWFVVRPLLASP